MSEEQLDEAAHRLGVKWNVTPDAQPVITPAEIRMIVHFGDTIKLMAKHKQCEGFLVSHGYWWKVVDAYHPPAGAIGKAIASRPPSWFLQSLPPNKQGGQGHKTLSNLWLRKDSDPDYAVVEVCAHPTEFKYASYKE